MDYTYALGLRFIADEQYPRPMHTSINRKSHLNAGSPFPGPMSTGIPPDVMTYRLLTIVLQTFNLRTALDRGLVRHYHSLAPDGLTSNPLFTHVEISLQRHPVLLTTNDVLGFISNTPADSDRRCHHPWK